MKSMFIIFFNGNNIVELWVVQFFVSNSLRISISFFLKLNATSAVTRMIVQVIKNGLLWFCISGSIENK